MLDANSSVPDGFRLTIRSPRYAVSEYGAVLSICIRGKRLEKPWSKAHYLSPSSVNGYRFVWLYINGRRVQVGVHVLVLETYVGPCPYGCECRHLDGNPSNNHISNLKWGTASENQHDKILHGTSSQGEACWLAKLTSDDVLKIRQRSEDGEPNGVIARDFHVTSAAVWQITHRRTWKHV